MSDFINFLKENLNLNGFNLVQTNYRDFIILKSYSKYSKCIYLHFTNEQLQVNIHKVFDTKGYYDNIERIFIDSKYFNNYYESFDYIQRNVAI